MILSTSFSVWLSLVHMVRSAASSNSVEASPTSPPGVGGTAFCSVSTPGPEGVGRADIAVPQPESTLTTANDPATFALIADILP
ncbi:hypothetical protein GCM10022224_073340 [Nonomuraea antimicrobica]|uniref:Secreted protein n=1 Tax=Nonomuraea antimicrobica TaxID=561173 RepID=A0ABP7CV02_9ACTN